MVWTHIYDLIVKMGILFLSIFGLLQISFLEGHGVVVAILSLVVSSICYLLFLRTIGSWLYCTLYLKMKVTYQQAQTMNVALAPLNQFGYKKMWLPLTEVKNMPTLHKYAAAQSIITDWQQEKKNTTATSAHPRGPMSKKTEIIVGLLIAISFILSYLQLPPATYLIELYCFVFQTEDYSPIFIGCLMFFVSIIPYALWIQFRSKSGKKR